MPQWLSQERTYIGSSSINPLNPIRSVRITQLDQRNRLYAVWILVFRTDHLLLGRQWVKG